MRYDRHDARLGYATTIAGRVYWKGSSVPLVTRAQKAWECFRDGLASGFPMCCVLYFSAHALLDPFAPQAYLRGRVEDERRGVWVPCPLCALTREVDVSNYWT